MGLADLLTQLGQASTVQKTALTLGVFISYIIAVVLYRLTLHPLTKFPGPFSRRISGWPDYNATRTGFRQLSIDALHAKYGRAVRLAPNLVSIIDPSVVPAVYGPQCRTKKGPSYLTFSASTEGSMTIVNFQDKKDHAPRRRIWQHGFSDKALRSSEVFVVDNVRKWIDLLDRKAGGGWSEELNMAEWCTWLTFDIMGDMAYGEGWNMLGDETNRWIPPTLMTGMQMIHTMSHSPLRRIINQLFPILSRLGGEEAKQHLRFKNLYKSALRRRLAQEPELAKDPNRRKDQMYWLINGTDPESGRKIPTVDLEGESSVLIVAGADTSATTLAAFSFYMVQNPWIQKRVAEELRRTFANVEEIQSGAKLQSCKFFLACIEETLRMSPNAGGMIAREVLEGGLDLTIDGKPTHLPAGTEVGLTLLSFHHSPETHPSPDTFLPDRWIPGNRLFANTTGPTITTEDVARFRAGYQPFSSGSRGCIGKGLALMELWLAAGRLLYAFEMEEVEGWRERKGNEWMGRWGRDAYPMKDWFIAERDGPAVRLQRRSL